MKLFCNLKNCRGIGEFKDTFDFKKGKAHLIYAPNGTMKTSFAKTFQDLSENKDTKDYIYPSRQTLRDITLNGDDLENDQILVINSYSDTYKPQNMNLLIANEDLKREYDIASQEINKDLNKLLSQLRKLSGKKRNIEELILADFNKSNLSIKEFLFDIYKKYCSINFPDYSYIKYSYIVNKHVESILSEDGLKEALIRYIDKYNDLINKSNIFSSNFNHNNAESTLSKLNTDGFFDAEHKIILKNIDKPMGEQEFKEIIQQETTQIIEQDMKEEFEEIDKILSRNKDCKEFREFIKDNKELIPELFNFDKFKQKLWISYIFYDEININNYISTYKENLSLIKNIIKKVEGERSTWEKVVEKFNDRFSNMPFKVDIKNKKETTLNEETPEIVFIYEDGKDRRSLLEDELKKHLSNGEKKALYILKIIFDLEVIIKENKQVILIIDDIADSFDYRNKYAIVEYLHEIIEHELFYPIILTHNFDFYRIVGNRLGLMRTKTTYFVSNNDGKLTLTQGEYFKNIFKTWKQKVYKNNVIFLASIAFIRNIVEYIDGTNSEKYNNLTSLLHYKKFEIENVKKTEDILVDDLIKYYVDVWGCEKDKFEQDSRQSVIDLLIEESDKINNNSHPHIQVEYKVVLSMVIRIKAEKYMIYRIDNDDDIKDIRGDQTRKLKKKINLNLKDTDDIKINSILERVLLMTPENIHLNSFMFEPILDMDISELKDLYNEVNRYLIIN